jgi:hypothetical protein
VVVDGFPAGFDFLAVLLPAADTALCKVYLSFETQLTANVAAAQYPRPQIKALLTAAS